MSCAQGRLPQQNPQLLAVFFQDGASLHLVLAPFRGVADEVRKILKKYGVRSDRTGTIHTSQGKEADVVVFALGGSPDREGALDWAARTPNLLNVAASRAKRRLYVIGDHQTWAHRHRFQTLGQHLPLREEVDQG